MLAAPAQPSTSDDAHDGVVGAKPTRGAGGRSAAGGRANAYPAAPPQPWPFAFDASESAHVLSVEAVCSESVRAALRHADSAIGAMRTEEERTEARLAAVLQVTRLGWVGLYVARCMLQCCMLYVAMLRAACRTARHAELSRAEQS
jgi:hypothetical protein